MAVEVLVMPWAEGPLLSMNWLVMDLTVSRMAGLCRVAAEPCLWLSINAYMLLNEL